MNRDERTSGSGPGVAAAADPMIGQILDGRYRLLDRLGEGGMGEVYAAEHVHIEKRVAIKLLRNEILTNQEAVHRFRQEARSASSIGHRNIIAIEDFGQLPDGRIYLAMELLHGSPLSDLIKQPQPAERLINILIQTGHGLAAAHKKGIVHRDMKPENVFVTITAEGEDVPKLLDFGIAKMSGGEGNNHLTKTGTIFGTPFYMAPEQALGQNVDHRADVYAMGVIMYEAFGGVVPFQGDSFMAILTQHITSEPRPLGLVAAEHGKALPPGIEEIIVRAMRKEAEQRFQTMDELVAALVACYRGVAGAGMSGYMAAHRSGSHSQPALPNQGPFLGPSGTIAATPPPGGRGPMSHTPMGHTPMPYHGSTPPPVRYPVPQPDPQFTSGVHSAADSGAFAQKKSRGGLIILLIIVMAAVGSGIGLLVVQQQKGGKKTAGGAHGKQGPTDHQGKLGGDQGQTGPDNGGKTGPDNGGKSGPDNGGKTGPDDGGKTGPDDGGKTGPDNGGKTGPDNGTGPAGSRDAGTAGTDGDGKGQQGTGVPAPEKAWVLVNSRPQGAEIIGPGGERLGRTPTNVQVEPGKPLQVTLKLRRHKDLSVSIDDAKKKVTVKLEKVPRPSTGGTTGQEPGVEDPGTGEPPVDTTEPPKDPKDQGPCAEDPNSVACRCEKNPDQPECALE